jgi:hypothetical protein
MTARTGLLALEQSRAELRGAVERVPPTLRDVRPAPDRWSTAEVLEHLVLVESSITRLLTKLAAQVEALPSDAEAAGSQADASPDVDLLSLLDRTQRIESFEAARPTRGLDWATAWQRLEHARTQLLATIGAVQHLALERVTFPHFVVGPLTGFQWIEFAARHEQRHALQIIEGATLQLGEPPGADGIAATGRRA